MALYVFPRTVKIEPRLRVLFVIMNAQAALRIVCCLLCRGKSTAKL